MFPRTIENSLSNAEARERIYRATGQFPTVTALEAPTSPLCAVPSHRRRWLAVVMSVSGWTQNPEAARWDRLRHARDVTPREVWPQRSTVQHPQHWRARAMLVWWFVLTLVLAAGFKATQDRIPKPPVSGTPQVIVEDGPKAVQSPPRIRFD
jgi:hypothetical protein